MTKNEKIRRNIWINAYNTYIRVSYKKELAAEMSDEALAEYDKRFNKEIDNTIVLNKEQEKQFKILHDTFEIDDKSSDEHGYVILSS
jgi:hypothetical protein